MDEDNKRNLEWFEAASMRALFTEINEWQAKHRKRFASLNVQRDGERFCCIAVTNPTEVIIMDGERAGGVDVRGNALKVWS
jgi:hypothetical protein